MKSSELLRKAQMRIVSGKSTFVCYAITGAAGATEECIRKAEALRTRVMASIYPHANAATWLHLRIKPEQNNAAWSDANEAALREWRVRWLDALIAEYEAKGD